LFVFGDIEASHPTEKVGGVVASRRIRDVLHATTLRCHVHARALIIINNGGPTTNGHDLGGIFMTIFTVFLASKDHILLHITKGSVGRCLDNGAFGNQVHCKYLRNKECVR
jgi:hypothetical protein